MTEIEIACFVLMLLAIVSFWSIYVLFQMMRKHFWDMRALYRSAEKSNTEAMQLAHVLNLSLKVSDSKVKNLQSQLTIQQTQMDGQEHYDAVRRHMGQGHVVTEVSFVDVDGTKSVIAVHDDEVLPYPVSFVWIDQQISEHRARRAKIASEENPWRE